MSNPSTNIFDEYGVIIGFDHGDPSSICAQLGQFALLFLNLSHYFHPFPKNEYCVLPASF